MKKQQGFTLIELMIVVAIVAILAAIALPAAQDFLVRAKVSEALAAMGTCKTSVAEYYAAENALPAGIDQAGCTDVETQYVQGVGVVNGVITVTLGDVGRGQNGRVLTLTPDVDAAAQTIIGWDCGTDADRQFVPATCRH